MYYKTSEEHEALRAEIREWAEREIKPIAFTLDKNSEESRFRILLREGLWDFLIRRNTAEWEKIF